MIRGREYEYPFVEIYLENEIIHQTSAHQSPQPNGIAVKKNQTLKEMINILLISKFTFTIKLVGELSL